MAKNVQVLLANRPEGWVTESNFEIVERDIPKPAAGEILVRNHWLSLDPYMRGRMGAGNPMRRRAQIGEVMVGGTVGEVIESTHPQLQGRAISSPDPSAGRQYGVSDGERLPEVDPKLVPLSAYLGAVGMPGVTAWIGLLEHCAAEGRRDRGGIGRVAARSAAWSASSRNCRAAASSASPAARRNATTW